MEEATLTRWEVGRGGQWVRTGDRWPTDKALWKARHEILALEFGYGSGDGRQEVVFRGRTTLQHRLVFSKWAPSAPPQTC